MKKLSLKNLKLDANDLLQREQLKTVFGGYDGGYTPGCPGYSPGNWSFYSGNGYSGCACVSHSDAQWGSQQTGTSPYQDSRC